MSAKSKGKMILGVDFDNTIVSYDEVMHEAALRLGLIDKQVRKNKKIIRDAIRRRPNGEIEWQKLQAHIYTKGMRQAHLIQGAKRLIQDFRRKGIDVFIVSHKTEFSAMDQSKTNLRDVALQWMKDNEFFQKRGLNLSRRNVYFESTRKDKVKRIKNLGCTHFIDDLEETFLEPAFPKNVEGWLYSPHQEKTDLNSVRIFDNWDDIYSRLGSKDISIFDVQHKAEKLLSVSISDIERLGGGGNSRVYRLGQRYVIKFYFQQPKDKRNRLKTEFLSLKFLHEQGIGSIPKPIVMDQKDYCAIYEYIDGNKINNSQIGADDIESAVRFLSQIEQVKSKAPKNAFLPASEAFFSVKDVLKNVEGRLKRLQTIEPGAQNKQLQDYLKKDFVPFWTEIKRWIKEQKLVNIHRELEFKNRILSPSDFGFHNALRTKREIVFLDFEYFGWDDPAKTISDFLLHPAMDLSQELKRKFAAGMLEAFNAYPFLNERLKVLYPVFGLKWCMIFLNEFVKDDFNRRSFAAQVVVDKNIILKQQLNKSRSMLQQMQKTYRKFPYAS